MCVRLDRRWEKGEEGRGLARTAPALFALFWHLNVLSSVWLLAGTKEVSRVCVSCLLES